MLSLNSFNHNLKNSKFSEIFYCSIDSIAKKITSSTNFYFLRDQFYEENVSSHCHHQKRTEVNDLGPMSISRFPLSFSQFHQHLTIMQLLRLFQFDKTVHNKVARRTFFS